MNKTAVNLHLILSIILSIFGTTACSDKDQMEIMDKVDAVIDEYPDSALTILSAIDPTTLRTREGKARHSLLHSLSIIKCNGLSDTAMDMFNNAYEFYSKKKQPSRETMITHFIKALAEDSVAHSLKEFDKSIEMAAGKGKWDYIALAFFNKASIYADAYSTEDEMECIKNGSEYLDSVKRIDVIAFAAKITGSANLVNERYDEAEKQFTEFRRIADINQDSANILLSHIFLGSTYVLKGQYERAVTHFDSVALHTDNIIEFSSNALSHYALSLIKTKRYDEAWNLINIMSNIDNPVERGAYYTSLASYHSALGNYADAYALTDSLIDCTNAAIIQKMRFSLPRQEKDLEKKLAEANLLAKEKGTTIICLNIMLVVCILIIFIIALSNINRHRSIKLADLNRNLHDRTIENEELENRLKILKVRDSKLENELYETEHKLTVLLKEKSLSDQDLLSQKSIVEQLQYRLTEMRDDFSSRDTLRLKEIEEYKEKIEAIEKEKRENMMTSVRIESQLCNNLIISQSKEDKINYMVIINKYRNKEIRESLCEYINHANGGIIDYLRETLTIKERHLEFVVLDICGFDYKAIADILDITAKNASARKSRIKAKVSGISDTDKRHWLISCIPMLQ